MGIEKRYTIEEVAETLGVHRQTVYNYLGEGRLNAVKIGKRWYIKESDLQSILDNGLPNKGTFTPTGKR